MDRLRKGTISKSFLIARACLFCVLIPAGQRKPEKCAVVHQHNHLSINNNGHCTYMSAFNDDDKVEVLDHDFGAVTFAYDYELGKSGLFEDMKLSLSSSAAALTENDEFRNLNTMGFSIKWKVISDS
ncbi:hypothetical protein DKX38_020153 [Salix brachista]|uniref:Legume lectin domain-containing protein n=1 Tax=Salix brachista TaxID=2182728 RepID=A0A5N5KI83_9ROSI|nr:hypothetical protein DKX38_020153 [Salix brachista]